jgi:threonine synthase
MAEALNLSCSQCGASYSLATREWVCIRCDGLLEISGASPFNPDFIDPGEASLWRYRAMLPLPPAAAPITMGEGWTPLVPVEFNARAVHFKLDFLMPSGSFKDRGTTVMVSAARALEIREVVEDSSGNAAASLAAYCARGGLGATIFVPAHASPAKLAQIQVYGAQLRAVPGVRENAARAAQDAVVSGGAYYASHYYNPFALFGMQTTAWEIWEQLGRRAPGSIVVPVGHGTNMLGLYRGFTALAVLGLITQIPRFFAAQSDAIAPLVRAFEESLTEPAAQEPYQTVAEGIAISRPVHGVELLRVLRETGGGAIGVGESDIPVARAQLARQGIYVEPTSAVAVAALGPLADQLDPDEITVVTLTGSGLKSPPAA